MSIIKLINFIKILLTSFKDLSKADSLFLMNNLLTYPREIDKNIICNMFPDENAATKLLGIILEKVSTKLGASIISKSLFVCALTPMPGSVRLATKSPKKIAIDVVHKYVKIVESVNLEIDDDLSNSAIAM